MIIARVSENKKFINILTSDSETFNITFLKNYFSKHIKNWKFNPKVRKKLWNGKINFMDNNGRIASGLWKKLIDICELNNEELIIEGFESLFNKIDKNDFKLWIDKFTENMDIKPRNYQINAVRKILLYKRSSAELATNSGKTLIIYLVFSYLKEKGILNKMLVIVPNVSLILQGIQDFMSYSKNTTLFNFKIKGIFYEEKDKSNDSDIIFGTFQSLSKINKEWFSDFNCICVDEAHHSSAKSVKDILLNCENSEYTFGLSGTLHKGDDADEFTVDQYVGPIVNSISTKDLIDNNYATPLEIKIIILNHSNDDIKKNLHELRYKKNSANISGTELRALEYNIINKNNNRNKKILSICKKYLDKNTLFLYKNVKNNYGKKIYNLFKKYLNDKEILYVDGNTKADLRDIYKKRMAENDDVYLVASYGTFSTGISINNLHYLVLLESLKSEKIIKQSLGRLLRLHKNKNKVYVFDIVDNLTYIDKNNKKHKNYIYKDFEKRLEIYKNEGYPYSIIYEGDI